MNLIDSLRMDKTAFSVTTFSKQAEEEKRYWLSKTPYERLQAIKVMRQITYGYDPSTIRLSEFLQLLNAHQVEYLLIGGYAVGYHGYPRAAGEMDERKVKS